jgi:hypothetical protein
MRASFAARTSRASQTHAEAAPGNETRRMSGKEGEGMGKGGEDHGPSREEEKGFTFGGGGSFSFSLGESAVKMSFSCAEEFKKEERQDTTRVEQERKERERYRRLVKADRRCTTGLLVMPDRKEDSVPVGEDLGPVGQDLRTQQDKNGRWEMGVWIARGHATVSTGAEHLVDGDGGRMQAVTAGERETCSGQLTTVDGGVRGDDAGAGRGCQPDPATGGPQGRQEEHEGGSAGGDGQLCGLSDRKDDEKEEARHAADEVCLVLPAAGSTAEHVFASFATQVEGAVGTPEDSGTVKPDGAAQPTGAWLERESAASPRQERRNEREGRKCRTPDGRAQGPKQEVEMQVLKVAKEQQGNTGRLKSWTAATRRSPRWKLRRKENRRGRERTKHTLFWTTAKAAVQTEGLGAGMVLQWRLRRCSELRLRLGRSKSDEWEHRLKSGHEG